MCVSDQKIMCRTPLAQCRFKETLNRREEYVCTSAVKGSNKNGKIGHVNVTQVHAKGLGGNA